MFFLNTDVRDSLNNLTTHPGLSGHVRRRGQDIGVGGPRGVRGHRDQGDVKGV